MTSYPFIVTFLVEEHPQKQAIQYLGKMCPEVWEKKKKIHVTAVTTETRTNNWEFHQRLLTNQNPEFHSAVV